jgi:hypothetical protein
MDIPVGKLVTQHRLIGELGFGVLFTCSQLFVMPAKAGTQGQRFGHRPGFPLARE